MPFLKHNFENVGARTVTRFGDFIELLNFLNSWINITPLMPGLQRHDLPIDRCNQTVTPFMSAQA